ncbi:MAG: hypothetical protein M5U09_05610 [Gammaproteobacteria bacterium]|nr:hypothetical protein [Gammaproteobacteria bacterium]
MPAPCWAPRSGAGEARSPPSLSGPLAGYWLGGKLSEHLNETDRVGIASTTERAIQTGSTSTWTNPDTGTSTRVMVSDVERRAGGGASGRLAPLGRDSPARAGQQLVHPDGQPQRARRSEYRVRSAAHTQGRHARAGHRPRGGREVGIDRRGRQSCRLRVCAP